MAWFLSTVPGFTLTQQQLTFSLVNELLFVTIGAGGYLYLNWYMPSYRHRNLSEKKLKIPREVLFEDVRISDDWKWENDGEVLQLLNENQQRHALYVRIRRGNHLTKEVTYDYQYFEMRRDQSKFGNHGC